MSEFCGREAKDQPIAGICICLGCENPLPEVKSSSHPASFCDACGLEFEQEDLERRFSASKPTGWERVAGYQEFGVVADPVAEIDLATEGQAIATILGSLAQLENLSKIRVLDTVQSLVDPARGGYSTGSAYIPQRRANGEGDPEVVEKLARLARLQGHGDDEAV